MDRARIAKFSIGQVVRHRVFPFRGVVFDVDPVFDNTEEWWLAIPEAARPRKDQPFYHLLAENAESEYIAYVSEQNLLPDNSGEPLRSATVTFTSPAIATSTSAPLARKGVDVLRLRLCQLCGRRQDSSVARGRGPLALLFYHALGGRLGGILEFLALLDCLALRGLRIEALAIEGLAEPVQR